MPATLCCLSASHKVLAQWGAAEYGWGSSDPIPATTSSKWLLEKGDAVFFAAF